MSIGIAGSNVANGSVGQHGLIVLVRMVESPQDIGAQHHQSEFEEGWHFPRPQHADCRRTSYDLEHICYLRLNSLASTKVRAEKPSFYVGPK